jgi:hypothetical protein
MIPPGPLRQIPGRQDCQLAFDFVPDRQRQPLRRGDKPGRTVRPVLGLAEQVGGHQCRIGTLVRQDAYLGGSSWQVI